MTVFARPDTRRPGTDFSAEPNGKVNFDVSEVRPCDAPAWEAYVSQRSDSTFVDSWRWREVLEKSYGLHSHWFAVRNNGEICGILALTLAQHPVFGTYLATAPFANWGGFYFETEEAAQKLLAKASALRKELGARYVVVRSVKSPITAFEGWKNDAAYAGYWLSLPREPDTFLREHLGASSRRLVNKALGNGLRIEFGGESLLEHFWFVISHAMKELGSPYHSRTYLEQILTAFGESAALAVVYSPENDPIGASLMLFHNQTAVQLHANVLRGRRSFFPGEFLYFSVISECCRRGIKSLDLGRSLIGSGNEIFKMKWRPVRRELAYWYNLAPDTAELPSLNQANPRLRVAIKTWQHLPIWFHRMVGPRLITGLL